MVDTSLRCLPLLSAPFYNMDTSLSWRNLLGRANSVWIHLHYGTYLFKASELLNLRLQNVGRGIKGLDSKRVS